MASKYRYREATGVTYRAIAALKHLPKCGEILKIEAYQYRRRMKLSGGNFTTRVDHRVKVFGTTGDMMFAGFGWGYFGEGCRGLEQLFNRLGVPCGGMGTIGYQCAHEIKMSDQFITMNNPVVDWRLEFINGTWKLTYVNFLVFLQIADYEY
jgi:hypothetical protein